MRASHGVVCLADLGVLARRKELFAHGRRDGRKARVVARAGFHGSAQCHRLELVPDYLAACLLCVAAADAQPRGRAGTERGARRTGGTETCLGQAGRRQDGADSVHRRVLMCLAGLVQAHALAEAGESHARRGRRDRQPTAGAERSSVPGREQRDPHGFYLALVFGRLEMAASHEGVGRARGANRELAGGAGAPGVEGPIRKRPARRQGRQRHRRRRGLRLLDGLATGDTGAASVGRFG
mmetsp:Transcript_84190/g.234787  ORF Transcript_84190/g.234787 Transcript_84190/m.234787 type:complete len:239 (-) Transcript_84190:569-1285(-)